MKPMKRVKKSFWHPLTKVIAKISVTEGFPHSSHIQQMNLKSAKKILE